MRPESSISDHFYGRRKGRPMQKARKEALEKALPLHLFATDKIDPDKPLWLEVGFGNGEHICALAEQQPDIQIIGCEPFENGVSACLVSYQKITADKAALMIWPNPAQEMMDSLPDACLERAYLLNPDPWPKKRHHKRRFINPDNLDRFARLIKPGGLLITSTDVDDLAEWMVAKAASHPCFEWTAETCRDWQTLPKDWAVTTRYHAKGSEKGHTQRVLIFKRL